VALRRGTGMDRLCFALCARCVDACVCVQCSLGAVRLAVQCSQSDAHGDKVHTSTSVTLCVTRRVRQGSPGLIHPSIHLTDEASEDKATEPGDHSFTSTNHSTSPSQAREASTVCPVGQSCLLVTPSLAPNNPSLSFSFFSLSKQRERDGLLVSVCAREKERLAHT